MPFAQQFVNLRELGGGFASSAFDVTGKQNAICVTETGCGWLKFQAHQLVFTAEVKSVANDGGVRIKIDAAAKNALPGNDFLAAISGQKQQFAFPDHQQPIV